MWKRVLFFFCFELISCKSREREREREGDLKKSKELERRLKRICVRDREKLNILKDLEILHLEIVRDEKNA